jgi:hypothetical protein
LPEAASTDSVTECPFTLKTHSPRRVVKGGHGELAIRGVCKKASSVLRDQSNPSTFVATGNKAQPTPQIVRTNGTVLALRWQWAAVHRGSHADSQDFRFPGRQVAAPPAGDRERASRGHSGCAAGRVGGERRGSRASAPLGSAPGTQRRSGDLETWRPGAARGDVRFPDFQVLSAPRPATASNWTRDI